MNKGLQKNKRKSTNKGKQKGGNKGSQKVNTYVDIKIDIKVNKKVEKEHCNDDTAKKWLSNVDNQLQCILTVDTLANHAKDRPIKENLFEN